MARRIFTGTEDRAIDRSKKPEPPKEIKQDTEPKPLSKPFAEKGAQMLDLLQKFGKKDGPTTFVDGLVVDKLKPEEIIPKKPFKAKGPKPEVQIITGTMVGIGKKGAQPEWGETKADIHIYADVGSSQFWGSPETGVAMTTSRPHQGYYEIHFNSSFSQWSQKVAAGTVMRVVVDENGTTRLFHFRARDVEKK